MFHKGENPLVEQLQCLFVTAVGETALDDWLRAHVINELIVMGLATDYCD